MYDSEPTSTLVLPWFCQYRLRALVLIPISHSTYQYHPPPTPPLTVERVLYTRTCHWMYCQHCLTPYFDLTWYYCEVTDSNISICYLCSCNLTELHVPTPFERLYLLQQTLFCDLLGISWSNSLVVSPLRRLGWRVSMTYWIQYPPIPTPIPIVGCETMTVTVLPKRIELTLPELIVLGRTWPFESIQEYRRIIEYWGWTSYPAGLFLGTVRRPLLLEYLLDGSRRIWRRLGTWSFRIRTSLYQVLGSPGLVRLWPWATLWVWST